MRYRTLFIFGTRPEAIKLCPVINHLRCRAEFEVSVCATAQHRELLDRVLAAFQVVPDFDLDAMLPGQTLTQTAARILAGLEPIILKVRPDIILVQGDTTTTLCGALAAFYQKIPVGHVEAGLRTWDSLQPFPEEMNRVLATRLASLHFAATDWAAANLTREGVDPSRVVVTGNPGIDAVLYVKEQLELGKLKGTEWQPDPTRKLIVVTAHRRESFGEGIERICSALRRLAERPDVQIVYPVHPNPNVREPVRRHLSGLPNICLLEPLDYVPFVDLMRRAWLLITDSGGIQEEGPSLGKPILVLREKTERPEAVRAGTVRLVGTDEENLLREVERLLDDPQEYERMAVIHNPYGDGRASIRIADSIVSFLKK
ncbi:MAG TPA: UDP-N-acetylglucosamine 2-epimerase (non-hydrolyzing) [Bryobacteraceae bacterium]|nr:UDP-N-acetylglucosamine 2-epimerase (non-hydrolyzing) [Bryobacteraceae bacterium]HOQ43816.1 UDP-N-acetylglucosamine 2-epimerase (non-hydrolyzing) [Bryobacteraceae bacterium]HPQ14797.1 UDP-N-acetylglucosamine 2-epimerase (non-hydrolyzing) [Bryobacteraceae bacterium]HPU71741.1 UDP-N-acetylglucosamine 2-epimerase (non-hydrolyzing) [Bryobacteraceae bacterium]